MPDLKPRPDPSKDSKGRTLYEVEVRLIETRTFYFWAESEKQAEAAGEIADDSLAVSSDFEEPEVNVRPIAESELPTHEPDNERGVETFIVQGEDDIRLASDVWAEEAEEAAEAERERIEREGPPDTVTPDLFSPA